MTEGTVTRWLKQVGDPVAADEPLVEVSTDKVDTEIPSLVAGAPVGHPVAEDETVAVGDRARRDRRCRCPRSAAPAAPAVTSARRSRARAHLSPSASALRHRLPAAAPAVAPAVGRGPPLEADAYVTPLVRKLAAEHRVDLATLAGTGVGGRIRKPDVLEPRPRQARKAPGSRSAAPAASAGGRRPTAASAAPASGAGPAARPHREDVAAAAGDRRADGRVAAGLRAADHSRRGRRQPGRRPARTSQARVRGP